MKTTGRLENWYKDPQYNILWGDLYDDIRKRWRDGQRIHTSSIVKMGRKYVYTLNSKYLLGKKKS